jgi:nucleotide-binding universal stress UspA family protein
MTQVVVPVRYPLSEHSEATLSQAIAIATERDAQLTVIHIDQYQDSHKTTRRELKAAVEQAFGRQPGTRYVVRSGLLVEEALLHEIVDIDADIVVIGKKQAGRWREMIRRLVDDPDIETFLRDELDCDVVTAKP